MSNKDKPPTYDAYFLPEFGHHWLFNYHYKQTAQILLSKQLEQLSEKHSDMDCRPALYLYRHYIELTLKDILWLSCRYAGEDPPVKLLFNSHNLVEIWNRTKGYFKKFLKTSQNFLDFLDQMIGHLKELDSNDLRYVVDKDGNYSRSDETICLNLFNAKLYLDYLSTNLEDLRRSLNEPFPILDRLFEIDLWENGSRKSIQWASKMKRLF
jgi:hypothetical protein